VLQSIVRLGHGGAAEGVGLYDVSAGQQVVLETERRVHTHVDQWIYMTMYTTVETFGVT